MTPVAQARRLGSRRTPTVFISYSHKDERWKDKFLTHLGVLQQQGLLDVWDDRKIGAGEDWEELIQAAMRRAKVAVLIVTADFLNSSFVLREEVPALLQKRKRSGMRIIPVVARPCAWAAVDWLKRMQLRPKDGQPLSGMPAPKADQYLTDLALEIASILREEKGDPTSTARGKPTSPAVVVRQQSPKAPPVRISETSGTGPRSQKAASPAASRVAASTVVRSSGHWVLLDGQPYIATAVHERADEIIMRVPVNSSAQEAGLRRLQSRLSSREDFGWAYQDDAALVTLVSAERESQRGKSVWLLTTRRSNQYAYMPWSEASFNHRSADEIAVMRARLILLDESPGLEIGQNDRFLESFLYSTTGPVKLTGGVIPPLWASRPSAIETFLRQARLHAVYALKVSHICEQIEELRLGPVRNQRLTVNFRGRRAARYSNESPFSIVLTGQCPLKK